MEEKERFESKYNEKLMKHYTFDNENKEELGYKGVVRVLNQQDKKIKAKEKEANTYAKEIVFLDNKIKLLKQSQKQLAIEELEKVKELGFIQSYTLDVPNILILKYEDFKQLLDNQIKELKGEE